MYSKLGKFLTAAQPHTPSQKLAVAIEGKRTFHNKNHTKRIDDHKIHTIEDYYMECFGLKRKINTSKRLQEGKIKDAQSLIRKKSPEELSNTTKCQKSACTFKS